MLTEEHRFLASDAPCIVKTRQMVLKSGVVVYGVKALTISNGSKRSDSPVHLYRQKRRFRFYTERFQTDQDSHFTGRLPAKANI